MITYYLIKTHITYIIYYYDIYIYILLIYYFKMYLNNIITK